MRHYYLAALLASCALLSATARAADGPFVFRDVAKQYGLSEPLRGMMAHAAAWGDVNGDGKLDLFVGSFADRPEQVYLDGGAKGPVPNVLLLQRDGKFVSAANDGIDWKGRATGSWNWSPTRQARRSYCPRPPAEWASSTTTATACWTCSSSRP